MSVEGLKLIINILIGLAFLVFSPVLSAQSQPTEKEIAQPQMAGKIKAIKQLIAALKINVAIEESAKEAAEILNKRPPKTDPKNDALNSIIYSKASAEFQKRKSDFEAEALTQLINEFDKRFSEPEIRYLLDATKYSVITRFSSLLYSREFQIPVNLFPSKATDLLRNARLEAKHNENLKPSLNQKAGIPK